MQKNITVLISIFLIGFVLNLMWENLQAPLYGGYLSFSQHLWVCFKASLGDGVIIVFLYSLFALFFRNIVWFENMNWKSVVFLFIIGTLIAIGIEVWALSIARWSYGYAMPIIPILKVGLTPVLQMMILPSATLYILSNFVKNKKIIL